MRRKHVDYNKRDEIDKLYNTGRWRKLRLVILKRDYELCQECMRRGTVNKGNTVHHKVEARDDLDLFWDESNLETICPSCHNREHPERYLGKARDSKKSRNALSVVKFYENNESQ